jgi:hypothetical protein
MLIMVRVDERKRVEENKELKNYEENPRGRQYL